MKEKQHITIRIADCAPIDLNIQPDKEALYRKIESEMNMIWAQWSSDFKDRSSKEILAMVAFRYAQVYYDLLESINADKAAIADAEAALDRILLDVK